MSAAAFLWLDLAGIVAAVSVALLCIKCRGRRLAKNAQNESSSFQKEFNQALSEPASSQTAAPEPVALPQTPEPIAQMAEKPLQLADAELLIKISTLRLRRNPPSVTSPR